MEAILNFAQKHNIYVIEDAAQSIGSDYHFADGTVRKSGTIGDIGTTSFFPSKNLGCMGDGGAIFTNNDEFAQNIRMVANHGQSKQYYHDRIGVNSRLDAIQAAILNVKLKYLDQYAAARRKAADIYDRLLQNHEDLISPYKNQSNTHVFHQYTLKTKNGKRQNYLDKLKAKGIPHNIYYPVPLYQQKAFGYEDLGMHLPVTEALCVSVFSLPMHTELTQSQQEYIVNQLLF
jgi:dTDP-4-amino-4,6-dideoxygalactose transaminase